MLQSRPQHQQSWQAFSFRWYFPRSAGGDFGVPVCSPETFRLATNSGYGVVSSLLTLVLLGAPEEKQNFVLWPSLAVITSPGMGSRLAIPPMFFELLTVCHVNGKPKQTLKPL